MCCNPIHPFKMNVKELNTDAHMLEVERPLTCCASACKCCLFQEANVTSDGATMGSVKETCYYWYVVFVVRSFPYVRLICLSHRNFHAFLDNHETKPEHDLII